MKRFLLIFFMFLAALAASAQSDEMERLRRQIAQYEKEIKAANDLISKSKKDQSVSEKQLKLVRTRLAQRREMVATLGKQLEAIQSDISTRRSDIMALEDRLTALRGDYAAMVRDAWKTRRTNDFLLFIFSSKDFNAAVRRAEFMRRYNRARADKAAEIAALSARIEAQVKDLDATRAQLDATRQTQTKEATTLAGDEKKYTSDVKKLTDTQKKLAKQVAEKQALRKKAQSKIDELIAAEIRRSRQSTLSEADQRAFDALSGRVEDNRGRLPYPISGGVIIDRFGEHAHSLASSAKINNPGVNISGVDNAPVKCVFEGTVAEIVSIPGMSRCVLVRHGNYITVYANLASTSVRKGSTVAAGQTLGRIGSGEDAFLHFEIHNESTPLNPELWLRR